MVKYDFNEKSEFVIEEYDKAKTFASFLPGIAGLDGIPLWSFYVNRGQGIGSFGVRDKNGAIMEFFPANLMYRNVELYGFRTFIKINNEIHEIFSSTTKDKASRKMIIEQNILRIEEINESINLKIHVTYFTMPRENFAAIVRRVEFESLNGEPISFEVLDGLTQILPFGVGNSEYQSMSNLLRSWFDVFNLENDIAFYKVRASTKDSSEVAEVNNGNFYLSFCTEKKDLIPPIVDMEIIFGNNSSFSYPESWKGDLKEFYSREQKSQNKVSGGFSGVSVIQKNKASIATIIGHVSSPDQLNNRKKQFSFDFIQMKENEARQIVKDLVEEVSTKTSDSLFDNYIEQCYLDNLLRGGYPLIYKAGEKNNVYHVFSRKHGDLEREYNFFSIEPAYYSQGNGNFRDVNQNRRNDVFIKPEVGAFNVKQFMNLIQIDGYNPLMVKGSTFTIEQSKLEEVLAFAETDVNKLESILKGRFTPGYLLNYIEENNLNLKIDKKKLIEKVLERSNQNYEAEFGEGYWSDHWTYNFDLIEGYLQIYPDKLENFMFKDNTYRFYNSQVMVLPREDKYVLVNGKVRQYGAIIEDDEKCESMNGNIKETNWLRTNKDKDKIYETSLYIKLVSLALNKFLSLDPYGIGIEMEADKPGWNDAMNGLPGLFGSSFCETAELKRIVDFIVEISASFEVEMLIPIEINKLIKDCFKILELYYKNELNNYDYWDKTSSLKECFRNSVRFELSGTEEKISTHNILELFKEISQKLDESFMRALKIGNGIYPSYLAFEANRYEIISGKKNPVNGYQNVKVMEFKYKPIPMFLEGTARTIGRLKDTAAARMIYQSIRTSEIYDKKLKMYKTSEPLGDTTYEIGRIKAFTPGWLERESIFMHMEYKYLLSLLRAGLYDEFYEDIKTALTPFMKPEVYGRSTLENSSFIASSVNPDDSVHGRGYVARLSGSTAEMLSMWVIMMAGHRIFTYENNQLMLTLCPKLPGWFFDNENKVSFRFLGKVDVTYYNTKKANTYGDNGVKINRLVLTTFDNMQVELAPDKVCGVYAEAVRAGEVKAIECYLL